MNKHYSMNKLGIKLNEVTMSFDAVIQEIHSTHLESEEFKNLALSSREMERLGNDTKVELKEAFSDLLSIIREEIKINEEYGLVVNNNHAQKSLTAILIAISLVALKLFYSLVLPSLQSVSAMSLVYPAAFALFMDISAVVKYLQDYRERQHLLQEYKEKRDEINKKFHKQYQETDKLLAWLEFVELSLKDALEKQKNRDENNLKVEFQHEKAKVYTKKKTLK